LPVVAFKTLGIAPTAAFFFQVRRLGRAEGRSGTLCSEPMAALTTHTTEQRAFIVWCLANVMSPHQTIWDFEKKFKGVKCTTDDVHACDPHRLEGDWKRYFDQERAAFYGAPNDKAFRMAVLSRIVTEAESRKVDPATTIKALELMAKEEAGFFVPKTKAASEEKDGVPIDSSITWKIVDPDGDV
jgi:hypothetical protein